MWRRVVWMSLAVTLALLPALVAPRPAAAQSGVVTLDFEDSADGQVIGATIPGVTFSNSSGAEWTYGDVRTGRYNAPYPQICPDFGGVCAYAVSGNGFAWMGEAAGVGRIDFIGATASFFGAGFSTADTLTVSAYDAAGVALASQTISPNLRTGRLDRVALTAPAGSTIAYVLISGGQNRWLMDDLATDARVLPPPQDDEAAAPALIRVVQRPAPNLTVAPGGVLTLTIEVANRGRGLARDVLISLPIDPATLTLLDASFSREGAWVSALAADRVEIRSGALAGRGDTLTITLRLRVNPGAPIGAAVGARISFRWQDGAGGGAGRSNFVSVLVGEADLTAAALPLAVEPSAPGHLRYTTAVLAPFEPVGVWYNAPGGAVVAVASLRANADGVVDGAFEIAGLPAGAYSLVVAGEWSQITSLGAFEVADAGGS